jgi:hypothetical protein
VPGFFNSFFRRTTQKSPSAGSDADGDSFSEAALARKSFAEIIALLKAMPTNKLSSQDIPPLISRLRRIALFDNHIPQQDRVGAMNLVDALTRDLQEMLAGDPKALKALKDGEEAILALARQGGVGSLIWRLDEYSISTADTIPYFMKPEHRHLVPDALEAMPTVLSQTKRLLVEELVKQSHYKTSNSVLILYGLVAGGDKAVPAIFNQDERQALSNTHSNYKKALNVLVELGMLQTGASRQFSRPFNELYENILSKAARRSEGDSRLNGLERPAFGSTRILHC